MKLITHLECFSMREDLLIDQKDKMSSFILL